MRIPGGFSGLRSRIWPQMNMDRRTWSETVRIRRTARSCVVAIVSVVGSMQASAQIRPPYEPLTAESVQAMAEELGLSTDEAALALEAFQRYSDELAPARTTLRELGRWNYDHRIDLMYYDEDEATANDRAAVYTKLEQAIQRGVRKLEERFFEQLDAIAPDQPEMIDSLRRARLRERVLPIYGLYNEFPHYVPLFDVAEFTRTTLGVENLTAEVEAAVLDYELAIEPMLLRIDKISIDWPENLGAAHNEVKARVADGETVDFDDLKRRELAPILEGRRLVGQVRQIEERTLQRLASLVPAELAEEFRAAHNEHLMDWIEDEGSEFESYLAAALDREGLGDANRSRLEAIGARFKASRARAMPGLVARLRELHDIKYTEGWYAQLVRLWQDPELGQWVVYEPPEYLGYEEQKREWREIVRDLEREAREILGEFSDGASQ